MNVRRRSRQVVAVVVVLAMAIGVGLFVAMWALGDGGTEDGRSATLSWA